MDEPSADPFRDRRALITGGAVRLGRATALALGRSGAHLAIHYNSSGGAADELCAELRSMGVEAVSVQSDLDDPRESEGLFHQAWEALGGLDYLVNNASIFPAGRLEHADLEEDLYPNIRINAWSPFILMRAFWRKVREEECEGSVVNLLDSRLVGGDLAHAPYHLSKAMLAELTTLGALEFAPSLRVNGVAPGAILPPEGQDDEYLEAITSDLPLGRRGYPDDIADAILYLLRAAFVTGQVVFVDGGRHLRLGGST